jgi:hypothetical protein
MGFRVIGSFRAFSSLGRPRCSNFGPNQFLKPTILRRVASMKVACQVQIRHQKIPLDTKKSAAGTVSSVQAKAKRGRWPTIKTAPAAHHQ